MLSWFDYLSQSPEVRSAFAAHLPVLNERKYRTEMTTSAYRLSEDSYVCLANNQLVFSNLRDDRYSCLNRANTQAALRLFPGIHEKTNAVLAEYPGLDPEDARLVLRELADNGLLVDGTKGGKAIAPIRLPVPISSLLLDNRDLRPRCHVGHWASFLQASLIASGKLHLQSLRHTVRGVESRKRRRSRSNSQDQSTLSDLVAIFHHLRPYYVREYLCRFDSLALVEFLAHYRHFPQWVFGVKSEPFGAHCWVQEDDCVLNDSVDYISQFTPIMAF